MVNLYQWQHIQALETIKVFCYPNLQEADFSKTKDLDLQVN